MKTIEFFYQETEIHFLVNPNQKNVMVNATEMAKHFGKDTRDYLANKSTKLFIEALERGLISPRSESNQPPNGGRSENKVPEMSGNLKKQIIDYRGHMGVYFERRLALDFAAWLDVDFRVWVFSTLDDILFGNYRRHWDAHARQESAKARMEMLKEKLITSATPELAVEYFEAEREFTASKNEKTNAIKNQLKLFDNLHNTFN